MDDFGNLKESISKSLKNGTKKVINILKKPLKKAIIVIAIIAIIIIAIAASFDALMEQFSKKIADYMQNNPVQYDIKDNSILITEEQLDKLEKLIANMGQSLTTLKLTRDDLKKLYAAEIVTSEINRGVTEEEGKFYGRVYVKRAKESTEDLEDLICIAKADLEQKVTAFEKGTITEDELLKYFAIDGDQICIVNNISTQTDNNGVITRTAILKNLDYKDKISQFTMPVEFLLDICLISKNPGFTVALAEKVLNETEINIALLQNSTTTDTTITYRYQTEKVTYTKYEYFDEFGKHIDTEVIGPDTTIEPGENTFNKTVEKNKVHTTSTSVKIASVKSWFVDLKYTYNKVPKQTSLSIPFEDPSNKIEDEEKEGTVNYKYVRRIEELDGSYKREWKSTNTRKINQARQIDTVTNTISYEEGPTEEPKPKTEEVVKLLKTPFTVPNSFIKEAAVYKLSNGSGIFFKMLQNGSRTQKLEQLMRFFLGQASGNNYGVSEFDFNIFDVSDFISADSYYGNGFWWPVGGYEIETIDGKEFAKGAPTATNITSPFGNRDSPTGGASTYHQGIDIGNGGYGTNYNNIIAVTDGIVTNIGDGQADGVRTPAGGNFVEIDHGNGTKTVYRHLYIGSIKVSIGDNVKQGQVIAKMGNSGVSTAAHLHFEVRINGTATDPTEYVSGDNPRPVGGSAANFSLTNTSFSQEEFKAKMLEYADKSGDTNFSSNFANYSDEIYTASVSHNINPELVVVTAGCETGWKKNSYMNYWGIGIPNGAGWSSGPKFANLTEGITRYASIISSYAPGGSKASMISSRYEERKTANGDPNGYGMPGTFAGMQSVYSFLGQHVQGSSGTGGFYYMDPAVAGVTYIYSSHQEFLDKCYNAGGEHAHGTTTTPWEQSKYTAWQCKKKVDLRYDIFGL